MTAVPERELEGARILLLVRREQDRSLLADHLADDHEVMVGRPDEEWGEFDCCLVDSAWYGAAEEALRERRAAAEPVYLPVLLLVQGEVGQALQATDGAAFDDVLSLPASRMVLDSRVDSALRARDFSLDLAQERDRFEALTESASDAILTVDAEGNIKYANPTIESILGYRPEDLLGEPLSDLIPERFTATHGEGFDAYLETDERTVDWTNLEFVARHADGHEVPIEVSLADYRTDGERRFVGVIRDISRRKEREQELAERERLFRAVFEGSFDAMVLADDDGEYVEVNEAACELFGVEREELLGRTVREFAPADYDFEDAWSGFLEGENTRGEFPLVRPDGEVRITEFAAAPNILPGRHLSVLRDVTERKEREQELAATASSFQSLYETVSCPDRSYEEKVQELLVTGAERLGVESGFLTRIEGGTQHVVAATGSHPRLQPGVKAPLERTYCRRTLEEGGALAVENAPEEGWEDDPAYEEFGLGCYIGRRIEVEGELYGTLCFADMDTRAEPYTDSEETLVDLMGQWVSQELERQEHEAELERTAESLREAQEIADLGNWSFDIEEGTGKLSETAARIYTLPAETWLPLDRILSVYTDSASETLLSAFEQAAESGEGNVNDLELELTDAAGADWVRLRGRVEFEDGDPARVRGTVQDITDRKERERALEQALDRLDRAQAIADIGAWEWDLETDEVHWTSGLYRIHDVPESFEPSPQTIPDRYHPEDRGRFEDAIEKAIKSGTEFSVEARLAADEEQWVRLQGEAVTEGGRTTLVRGTVQDITDRKEREQQLRSTQRRLEQAVDATGLRVWELDGESRTVSIAQRNEESILGIGMNEFDLDSVFLERVHPDDRERVQQAIEDTLAGETTLYETLRAFNDERDEWRWLELSGELRTDTATETIVGLARDITERKRREQNLEQYETIVEAAPDPIYGLDSEGRITLVNDALAETLGRTRQDLLGADISTILSADEVEEGTELIHSLVEEGREQGTLEISLPLEDGIHQYEVNLALLERVDGGFPGTVGVARDVTELRKRERRISVLDRVLRHNLRNKMNVVVGHAGDLQEADDPDVRDAATSIREAGQELLSLSDAARRFHDSIHEGATVTELDIAAHAGHVVEEMESEYPHADLRATLPDGARARAPESFELALTEVIQNAIVHSDRDEPLVSVSVDTDDEEVRVTVADDGPGIDEVELRALAAGIESPLQHTTGLGLWLVRWTVEACGGSLDISDREPRGTVVELRFPRADEA